MPSIQDRALSGNKRARASGTTTNGTAAKLSFGSDNFVGLSNNSAVVVHTEVVGRRTDTGSEVGGYVLRAVVKRGANAASTALVGSVGQTVIGEDTVAWDATIVADTTNGGFAIQVTGEAAKTIAWTAQVRVITA